jgi:hypothetical protein
LAHSCHWNFSQLFTNSEPKLRLSFGNCLKNSSFWAVCRCQQSAFFEKSYQLFAKLQLKIAKNCYLEDERLYENPKNTVYNILICCQKFKMISIWFPEDG